MSIVPIIQKLVCDGKLFPYRPIVVRAPHIQGGRRLWLTADANAWCCPPEDHQDSWDESLAHLGDQLNNFVWGEYTEYGTDIRRLCPEEKDIWEVRSHLKKPQHRLFGWFVLPKLFVGVHCKLRDDLERGKGPKWDKAIEKAEHARDDLVGHVPFFDADPGKYVCNPK